ALGDKAGRLTRTALVRGTQNTSAALLENEMAHVCMLPKVPADVRANYTSDDKEPLCIRVMWPDDILHLHFRSVDQARVFGQAVLTALDELIRAAVKPAEPIGVFVGRTELYPWPQHRTLQD